MPTYTICPFQGGLGQVTLTDADHLAEGGEARVYRKGSHAYKVWHQQPQVPPADKLRHLHERFAGQAHFLAPTALLQQGSALVGCEMHLAPPHVPLSRLLVTDYLVAERLGPKEVLQLVEALGRLIAEAHDKDCIVSDISENNFLVAVPDHKQVLAIDLSAWGLPRFPPQTYTVTTRDWAAHTPGPESDWFSFAVLSCQMFLGMHPFRGSHPQFPRQKYASVPPEQRIEVALKDRVLSRVSIFHKDVSVPSAMRPMAAWLPTNYRAWMVALFEEGKRLPPPDVAGALGQVVVVVKTSAAVLEIRKLYALPTAILSAYAVGGSEVVVVQGAAPPVGSERYILHLDTDDALGVYKQDGKTQAGPGLRLRARQLLYVDGTAFALSDTHAYQLQVEPVGTQAFAGVKQAVALLPGATQVFDGVLLVSALGVPAVVVLEPGRMEVLRLPQLKGYKVLQMKHRGGVIGVVGEKSGQIDRLWIWLRSGLSEKEEDIAAPDLNFTVLPGGKVVRIVEDGLLEVVACDGAQVHKRQVKDPGVRQTLRLGHFGPQVIGWEGNVLYTIKMK